MTHIEAQMIVADRQRVLLREAGERRLARLATAAGPCAESRGRRLARSLAAIAAAFVPRTGERPRVETAAESVPC